MHAQRAPRPAKCPALSPTRTPQYTLCVYNAASGVPSNLYGPACHRGGIEARSSFGMTSTPENGKMFDFSNVSAPLETYGPEFAHAVIGAVAVGTVLAIIATLAEAHLASPTEGPPSLRISLRQRLTSLGRVAGSVAYRAFLARAGVVPASRRTAAHFSERSSRTS
jgi:hypothetical protein